MQKYKDLYIDLDDTLTDTSTWEKQALIDAYNKFNIPVNTHTIETFVHINNSLWQQLQQGLIKLEDLSPTRFALTLKVLDRNDIEINDINTYYKDVFSLKPLFKKTKYTLKRLSKDYRLFLITNGYTDIQTKCIKNTDIEKYFSQIFISQQLKVNKPSIEYMNIIRTKVEDFNASKSLIIGDSLSSDIALANNCGIDSVWINPTRLANTIATYEIKSFNELPNLLKAINK